MYQSFVPGMNIPYTPITAPYMMGKGKMQFARAYIPDQPYVSVFPLEEALKKGTLFPNLYMPYPVKSKE